MKKVVGIMLMVVMVLLLLSSCGVPQEEHDAVVAERDAAQAQVASLQSDLTEAESQIQTLQEGYDEAKSDLEATESELAATQSDLAEVQAKVADLQAGNEVYTRDPANPVVVSATGECQLLVKDAVYHLYYNGYPSITGCSVGHATASDPAGVFTPESSDVIRVGGHGGMGILMNPSTHEPILKSETELGIGGAGHTPKYWMFFSNEPGIFLASNEDLYGAWTYRTECNPVLDVTPDAWDSHWIGYNGIVVFEEDGVFKMLYHAHAGDYKYEIGLATSTNLRDWVKYEGNPVMSGLDEVPYWRCTPNDIWKTGDEYCLVYTLSAQDTKEQFAKAYSTDLISWAQDVNNPLAVPIGTERSISDFGIFREEGMEYIFYEAGGGKVDVLYGVYRMWREIDGQPPELP